jgi:hypothetical protein
MLVKDFECRSFEAAKRLLDGKVRMTVCNNTVLYGYDVDRIVLALHGHDIVYWCNNGALVLNSCGHKTALTKDRINRCLRDPWVLCQEKGEWFLWNGFSHAQVKFRDGIRIPRWGRGYPC